MATPTATPERPPAEGIEPENLYLGLKNVTQRVRLVRSIRWAALGVIAGSVAALGLLILSRFDLLPLALDLSLAFVILGTYLLSVGISLFLASTKTIDVLSLARFAEQRLDLKERLSSALTLDSRSGDVTRLLRDDASRYADRIDPRVLIPWRLTWELPTAVLSLLAVLLVALVPASPLSVTAPDRVSRVATAREGSKLEDVARQVLRQSDQAAPPPVKDAARHLQRVAKAMQSRHATSAQAVHDLQQLSDQIKKANQQAADSAAGKPDAQGSDQAAQARAAAQRELDHALQTDAKGGDRSAGGNPGQNKPSTSSNAPGPGMHDSGTGAKNSSSAKGASADPRQSSGPRSPRPGTGLDHPSGSTQPGTHAAPGKSDAESSKLKQTAQPRPSSGTQTASHGKPAPGAKTGSETPGAPPKSLNSPKSGKDFGKSAAQGNNPTTQRPATDGQLLGDKLRQYADKIAQRPMATGERDQAADSLDKLNQKLNDAKMPQTQQHVQAAAQALREGRQQDAVSELRKAADAADRETPVTEQQTSGQSASSQSSPPASSGNGAGQPQNGASQQMQRAINQSKQNLSGHGQQSGQGQQSSQNQQTEQDQKPGQGSGSPSNPREQGSGNSGQSQQGNRQAGQPRGGSPGNSARSGSSNPNPHQDGQPQGDTAHVTGGAGPAARNAGAPTPGFPGATRGSGKVVLTPLSSGGRMIEKPVPGKETPQGGSSSVPYYHITPQFKKAAEHDAGTENIPPAYRQQIKKYFDSLTPPK